MRCIVKDHWGKFMSITNEVGLLIFSTGNTEEVDSNVAASDAIESLGCVVSMTDCVKPQFVDSDVKDLKFTKLLDSCTIFTKGHLCLW